jgi:chromosome partitioning protein
MQTIALVARKGGCGKTTVAVHLALAAWLRGLHVLLADVDPQLSATEALRERRGLGPSLVTTIPSKLYALQMNAVREGMDLMIIDTAAGMPEDHAHAVVLADLSLVVVRPSFLDLAAAIESVAMIRRVKKPVLMLVNQAPPARDGIEPPTVRRALKALAVLGQPIAPTLLRSRITYQSALETGRSAEELGPPAAAREVAELWAFVQHMAFSRRAAS